ncbi:MAG: hypothetical protein HW380_2949 [Magnetococcales bacterium]|nr:hypothetical protein [Magnetococcales bacterium]HIJ85354.1 hypothetical protein [Magnetococcales bacterium]
MRRPKRTFNPKREVRPVPGTDTERENLVSLASKVVYGGNPEHKRNPGDFGLTPPSSPRQGKTLCDSVGIFTQRESTKLLREGVRRGVISRREKNGWPQNVWAVDANGMPMEAQLENAERGIYHGYPMPETDIFREKILERWGQH